MKRVNKLYSHTAHQREDFLQKLSTEIANQYDGVCIEDLDMRAMANKGFGNGKATNVHPVSPYFQHIFISLSICFAVSDNSAQFTKE